MLLQMIYACTRCGCRSVLVLRCCCRLRHSSFRRPATRNADQSNCDQLGCSRCNSDPKAIAANRSVEIAFFMHQAGVDASGLGFPMNPVAVDAWDFRLPMHQVTTDVWNFAFPIDHVADDVWHFWFPMHQAGIDAGYC